MANWELTMQSLNQPRWIEICQSVNEATWCQRESDAMFSGAMFSSAMFSSANRDDDWRFGVLTSAQEGFDGCTNIVLPHQ